VRAFELALGSEVVYLERDRERSLAFRLFRDGIRRLSFRPGLEWEEILGLVEILSVRYTSVRQQEDDIVTLLARTAFPHVGFVAIEGFVPDEEEPDEGEAVSALAHLEPPPDWDLPGPEHGGVVPCTSRSLTEAERAPFMSDPDDESSVRECVDLVLDLLECLADERQEMVEEDVESLVFEVRDFLVGEGRFGALLEIIPALERSSAGDLRPRPSILARFGGRETLRRLAETLQRRGKEPSAEVVQYLHAVPGNHLGDLLDLLEAETEEPMRLAFTALITALAEDRPREVIDRLERAEARSAILLLEGLARVLPEQAAEAALRLKDRPDPRLQVAALAAFSASAYTPALARTVVALLGSPYGEVRHAAVDYLAAHRDPRAYEALTRHAVARAGHGLTDDEAEHLGEALSRQDPPAALSLFLDWLPPPSRLKQLVESPAQKMLHRLAVAGLARVPGAEAENALRSLLERSTGDLHQLCLSALVQRRREQRAREGAPCAG
jgi:hypothetical protein